MEGGITLPLKLSNAKIIKTEEDAHGDFLIYVETTESNVNCHRCGQKITKLHGKDRPIKLRHLSAFEYETYVIYEPHRYICEHCDHPPTTTATPAWHQPNSAHTHLFERRILLELVNSAVVDVSIKENITEEMVLGILDRHIQSSIDWSLIRYLGIIGIDEISLKKGYQDYVTVITHRHHGKITLLAVLKGRKKSTIKDFFNNIPKQLKKTVDAICTDLYDGYVQAAKEVFKKKTIIVIDRFHVATLYRGELDKFRQKILHQLKQELSAEDYEKLKGATHILRRNNECLSKEEKVILNELFSLSFELMEAYRLAIKLTHIFNSHLTKKEALVRFQEWIILVRNSTLTCFNKFIKTFKKYKNEIANYFVDRNSSGFVEGLNNKIKVLKRRCYGIFNVKRLFQRLYLDLSGYDFLLGETAC